LSIDRFVPLDTFDQFASYFFGLYFVGCVYASTIFAELGNKAQGINWLSLPASHLEKLLCAIFFCLLFFVFFTLIFYLVDIPMVKWANHLIVSERRVYPGTLIRIGPNPVLNIFNGGGMNPIEDDSHIFLIGFFSAQSAFILGSVYFTRYSFIKTTIAVLLLILLSVVIITKGLQSNIPAGWRMDGLVQWVRYKDLFGPSALIRLPWSLDKILSFLVEFGTPIIGWFITYFRLKEKEV
jgi:hypothetical protein